jgi:hypothetical protein
MWLLVTFLFNYNAFKGKRFGDVQTTEHNAMEQLLGVPKTGPERCF